MPGYLRKRPLTLGTTLLLIFLSVTLLSGVVIHLVVSWQERSSVSRLAREESERISELLYQHMLSVMRRGWTREDIVALSEQMAGSLPEVEIAVIRSQSVAAQYGRVLEAERARGQDADITAVLAGAGPQLIETDDSIRFLRPLVVEDECLGCHQDVAVGDVNGVLDIAFPVQRLRVPLEFTVRTAVWSFAAAILVLFVVLFLNLRQIITRPIIDLSSHMRQIRADGDIDRRLTPGRLWPAEVRELADDFNVLMDDLDKGRRKLTELSVRDPLTGLFNRRRFDEVLARETSRSDRYERPFSVLLLDLDGFKQINDTHGHGVGDRILVHIGDLLEHHLRQSDLPARLGGDEFAILAPECPPDCAAQLATKIQGIIDGARLTEGEVTFNVGASIGTATCPQDGCDGESLMAAADEAMYANKVARRAAQPHTPSSPA